MYPPPTISSLLLLVVFILPCVISSLHDEEEGSSTRDTFRFGHGASNLTIQVGSTAYLHCPVSGLGERELSWVRRRDWHILTHGNKMFTQDDRFQLIREEKQPNINNNNNKDEEDWVLIIRYVTARDTGIYECQVTSDTGIQSLKVELKVETPEAFILADEEYHIDRGSSLSLVCIIEKATEPPQYVFWYHNDRMINYDSERGITVTTTPGRKTHSQLLIQRADVSDSGNYTCAPSSSLPASIQVFVSGSDVKPWTSGALSMTSSSSEALLLLSTAALSLLAKLRNQTL